MKSIFKSFLLTLVMLLMSLDIDARTSLFVYQKATVDHPYTEIRFQIGNLKGRDDRWRTGPRFTVSDGSATTGEIYLSDSHDFSTENVHERELNHEIHRSENFIVIAKKIIAEDGNTDWPMMVMYIYKRKDPLGQFHMKLWGRYGMWDTSGESRTDEFTVPRASQEEYDKLNALASSKHEVYAVGEDDLAFHVQHNKRPELKRRLSLMSDRIGSCVYTTDGSGDQTFHAHFSSDKVFTQDQTYSLNETLFMEDEKIIYDFPHNTLKTKEYAEVTKLSASVDPWKKWVKLSWDIKDPNYDNSQKNKGRWYIYRMDGKKYTLLGDKSLTKSGSGEFYTLTDKDDALVYDKSYKYTVCFIPDIWLKDGGEGNFDPSAGPLGYTSVSTQALIERTNPISRVSAIPGETSIMVKWQHEAVPTKNLSGDANKYEVQRRTQNSNQWKILKTINVTNSTSVEDSLEDNTIESSEEIYYYKVVFDRGDVTFTTEAGGPARVGGATKVTSVSASKGAFNDHTIVMWSAHQVGTKASEFRVSRRDVTSDTWSILYTTQGTNSDYTFTDATSKPGHTYLYRVTAYTPTTVTQDGQSVEMLIEKNSITSYGFSQSLGTVSGQVTFNSGMGVDSVRVELLPNSDGENATQNFFSSFIEKDASGIQMPIGTEDGQLNGKYLASSSNFTVGLWVKPEEEDASLVGMRAANDLYYELLRIKGNKLGVNRSFLSDMEIPNNRWTYVFLSHASDNTNTLGMVDSLGVLHTTSVSDIKLPSVDNLSNLEFANQTEELTGSLYIDEVRVYSRQLSENEIMTSYNRMLSGDDKGLQLYWPMNEGNYTGNVFDFSRSNDVPNGAHGVVQSGVSYSQDSPNASELVGLYALTSNDGSYTISGVPFSGNGTNYTVVPSKGIHEFASAKLTRFVGPSSLVHSGVDFTDCSSFPVHGTIRYAGTTIPVEDCTFEVDGNQCINSDKNVVKSAADGSYTISVPIGSHYITVKKDNHVFAGGGRYPEELGTADFLQEVYNLDFVDSTLVNFTGRIVGGFRDRDKAIGFNQSKNNIGRVEMTLKPTDTRYLLNAKKVVDGTTFKYDTNDATVEVPSDTATINSKSYRGAGSFEDCQIIHITTDSLTGEFSAMVPPVKYVLSDQYLVADSQTKVGGSQTVDLTDFKKASADTLCTDDTKSQIKGTYPYMSKYIADYHVEPTFLVNNQTFGAKKYTGNDSDGKYTIDNLYTVDGDKVTYTYGYPVFVTGEEYEFSIEAFEAFKNADAPKEDADKQPLEGCEVQVSNALSASQAIVSKDLTTDSGEELKEGQPYGRNINGLLLDKSGSATYTWCAGLPNTNADTKFANAITLSLNVSGKAYEWIPSENSGLIRADGGTTGQGMKGINLGAICLGKDFITSGPDKLLMVLRDPPGAKSNTTWHKGSSITKKTEKMRGGGLHNKDIVTVAYGVKTRVITGVVIPMVQEYESVVESKNDIGGGLELFHGRYNYDLDTETYVTNEDISTSADPEFVGSCGDVYIGLARNYIFGKAREVYIPRSGAIGVRDATGARDSVKTSFRYTQRFIQEDLIPGYDKSIKEILEPMENLKDSTEITVPHYYTSLAKTDPKYGTSNYDTKVWKDAAKTEMTGTCVIKGPSYTVVFPTNYVGNDTIQYMHNQINAWTNAIKENEKEKVDMYEDRNTSDVVQADNVTLDGGTKQVLQYSFTGSHDDYYSENFEQEVYVVAKNGFSVCAHGCTNDHSSNSVTKETNTYHVVNDSTSSFTCTLSDNNYCSHTIDVYRAIKYVKELDKDMAMPFSKNGWGPIFRTLAGRTYGPYEDGDSTKYYSKGEVLCEKTIQMEVPQLIIDEPIQNNVPSGGVATFKIKLSNQSYTGSNMYYNLCYDPATNNNGALILVDGMPLTTMSIYIPYNTTVEKVVQLKQSDTGILNYENIKLRLLSTTQYSGTSHWPVIQSAVNISAHFVPVSTPVTLAADKVLLNTNNGKKVTFTISDFDANHEGLKALRLQYRYANEDWVDFHTWVTGEVSSGIEEDLTKAITDYSGTPQYIFDMTQLPDGEYTFRAQSATKLGTDDEVRKESSEISVIKDMTKPELISLPTPTDGVLGIGSTLSAEFNEDIESGNLTNDGNIEVYGMLNNTDGSVHSVAVQGDKDKTAINTQNKIVIDEEPFALDFWARNVNGSLVALGSSDQSTVVGMTDKKASIVSSVSGVRSSQKSLPDVTDKWVFWHMDYTPIENNKGLISLSASYDDTDLLFFDNDTIDAIQSNGKMMIAPYSQGQFTDIAMWGYARKLQEAKSTINTQFTGLEKNLQHYWKFDEGQGKTVQDVVAGNNITLNDENQWFFSCANASAHLDAGQSITIPFTDSNIDDNDSYAMEYWFRNAGSDSSDKTIFTDTNNGVSMGLDAKGYLLLSTNTGDNPVVTKSLQSYSTGWHHVFLNVQRGISAMLYVDGENQMMISEHNVPTLQGAIRFGADTDGFVGDLDEIKIWKGTLGSDMVNDYRNYQIDTTGVANLVRYYPFEQTKLDSGNQLQTLFSLHNAAEPTDVTDHDMTGTATKSEYTAPLKEALKRTSIPCTFIASDRVVKITLSDDILTKLEGTHVNIVLKNIPDLNGNRSNTIAWNALVRKNPLRWSETGDFSVSTNVGYESVFTQSISNLSGNSVAWSLNLPSWLSASPSQGTLSPLGTQEITFTVSDDVDACKVTDQIGLININSGLSEKHNISLEVTGFEPEWIVETSDKEHAIPLTARLNLNGSYSEDENDILAAFIKGECVGKGYVQYNALRNAYYVNMTIYGGDKQINDSISFKAWDSSRNLVFTPLIRQNGGTMNFTSDAKPFGSYDNPEIFTSSETIEQSIYLSEGWNWVSFYVDPTEQNLNESLKSTDGVLPIIKTQDKSAVWNDLTDEEGNPVGFMSSSLTSLSERSMYAIKANEDISITIVGKALTGKQGMKTINKGWNWVRNPYYKNQSVASAFSGFAPSDEDVVETYGSYAQWSKSQNHWDGLLTSFQPGVGYKYYSNSDDSKNLFEDMSDNVISRFSVARVQEVADGNGYGYADNMSVIATLNLSDNSDVDVDTVTVRAINSTDQSFTSLPDRGFYVLTLAGADNSSFTFQAVLNGKVVKLYPAMLNDEMELAKYDVVYSPDALIGTFRTPLVLCDSSTATGIQTLTGADIDPEGSYEVYNLMGYHLLSGKNNGTKFKALPAGVYIANGTKVILSK